MLPDTVTVGDQSVSRSALRFLLGQILARLIEIALFTRQFLLKNMLAVSIARFLGIFLHPGESGGGRIGRRTSWPTSRSGR